MLRLPEFKYHQPRSLKQATKALADLGADAMLVAGGTDVYPKMKRGQFTPRNLISLRALRELKGIRQSKEGLWIGAGESLTAVTHHRLITKHFPALAHAAESVSTPQLRNMGTIGGNVLVDTRCNYYDQTFFLASGRRLLHEKRWRHLLGRAGQRKVPRDRVLGHIAGVGELGSGSNFGGSTGRTPRETRRPISRRRNRLFGQSARGRY